VVSKQMEGLLDGKEEISFFLNNATDYKLKKYIEAGMPVRVEGKRWLAHKENLEKFFREYTMGEVVNPEGVSREITPKQATPSPK